MSETKISVVIAAYNAGNTIAETIESVLNQTRPAHEIIIVNDASTDNTLEVISAFKDERIRVLSNESNLHLPASRNRGMRAATGDYIALMDADDICLPERFEKQAALLDSHPEIGLVGAWAVCFGNRNNTICMPADDLAIRATMLFESPFVTPSVMHRNDPDLYYQEESYWAAQDYDMYARIADRVKFANVPEVLLKYRVHAGQTSTTGNRKQEALARMIKSSLLRGVLESASEQDCELFCDAAMYWRTKDSRTMWSIDALYGRILDANRKKHIYDDELLYRKMAEVYLKNCYRSIAAGKCGFSVLKNNRFSAERKDKLIFRCKLLVKYLRGRIRNRK